MPVKEAGEKKPAQSAPDCKDAGRLVPVIDRNRCEAKADCVRVCPYGVFAIARLDAATRASLSFLGRLKARFHGWEQAFAIKADECHACGLCVTACPEKAITLSKPGQAPPLP